MIVESDKGAVEVSFPQWLLFVLGLRWYAFCGYWQERKDGPDTEHYVYKCRACNQIHVDIPRGFGRELRHK